MSRTRSVDIGTGASVTVATQPGATVDPRPDGTGRPPGLVGSDATDPRTLPVA